ncbi:YfhO family protein [Belliella sp. DSM 111904]|uniref:YfhO family protein n=1 Tax=Belliella filtrata TaxID=2923435 RepID=A0ABS9V0C0_9BACT|nr:YfhO family protein [Belliella filtrata]MCH7409861.1 YfhO family protein [Belliella filtrata]
MSNNLKKNILPHLISIAVFYLITLFYFSPAVFEGKIIFQNDILQWEGGAKEILDHRAQTGEEALWSNSMFGGMPAYLLSFEISGDITNFITKVLTLGLPHPINAIFFGMVSMYILLLSFKVRPEFSIIGAIAFAFNSFHIISIDAGHNAKIWAICLIPLILAGIHLAFHNKKLLGLGIFTLGLLLQLKFNHIQITYYTVIIVVVYLIAVLYQYIKAKALPDFAKVAAILVLGTVIAVGGNISRFLSVYEYGQYSTRGPSNLNNSTDGAKGLDKEYAFNWSQGKGETLTLLIPYFYGGGSREALDKDSNTEKALRANGVDNAQIRGFVEGAPTYWGDQPGTGGPIYGGAIMIFLFVLGLIYAPKHYKYAFLSITLISLILAWGKNLEWLNYAIFDYLPGYNKFRAVSMALCIALFSIPLLGTLGLEQLFTNPSNNKTIKNLLIALGCTAGVALLFTLVAGIFGFRAPADTNLPDWLIGAIQDDRKAMLRGSAFKSFIFITLSGALIWAALKEKLAIPIVGLGISLLLTLDLWLINKRYLNAEAFEYNPSAQFFSPNPADKVILKDQGYFRVLNLANPFNDARTSYFFNSIGGYHGAKMRRYQELIENVINPEMSQFIQKAQEGNFDFESIPALNMLNTKYIMAGQSENAVFENPMANGYAWMPLSIRDVSSNNEEISLIKGLNTLAEATINSAEFGSIAAGSGEVKLTHQSPNILRYEVDADKGGLVVFSEIYYTAGWKAYVNDQETDIVRTNYLLRGIEVPTGNSKVEMRFEPDSYYKTKPINVAAQYIWLLIFIGGIALEFKKKKS